MKLLGNSGSAFTTRVKFVLELKSIEYEYIEEELRKKLKSERLLTSNPLFQRVPVLFHANEHPLIESLAIMEYLDELRPDVHPILPSNPSERAQYRVLAYTFDNLYYPWMREFVLTQDKERIEELKRLIIEGFGLLEEVFVKLSKGKPFFGGDDIGYLDIVFGSFLGWIIFDGTMFGFNMIEEARNPRLAQWVKSMWSHEVVRALIPSQETHMEFYEMLISELPPTPETVSA
ncbi:hypothetical protein L1987_72842 [Smallanthus sonchifolius]|uniref:Uncharacterized protein n=1 Tax=Smallanthus sonchifolius TaxID=185202 RepID=A0ACB9AWC2_9ASTR|nr:hypothetical protein L1987_72842 [Smallanthus sonchifolius]